MPRLLVRGCSSIGTREIISCTHAVPCALGPGPPPQNFGTRTEAHDWRSKCLREIGTGKKGIDYSSFDQCYFSVEIYFYSSFYLVPR